MATLNAHKFLPEKPAQRGDVFLALVKVDSAFFFSLISKNF